MNASIHLYLWGKIIQKTPFVKPEHPAGNFKEKALVFSGLWNRRVTAGELIYTRNREGRPLLLKARALAFSSEFVSEAERLDQWEGRNRKIALVA